MIRLLLFLLLFTTADAQILTPILFGTPPASGGMISFAGAADIGYNGSSTSSYTGSYTVGSGTGRLLACGIFGANTGGGDDITSVTYNAVSMTLIGKDVTGVPHNNMYMYYLLAPASGANNVVISASTTHALGGVCADYAGVTSFDTHTSPSLDFNPAAATPANNNVPITTGVANTWTMLLVSGYPATITAGTGTTCRASTASFFNLMYWCDSNANIASAGATSLNFVMSAADNAGTIIASFH